MSIIARTGNVAEKILCKQANICRAFHVETIVKADHGMKTDAIADDGRRFQVKNVDRNSKLYRGHSVDRRSWTELVKIVKSLKLRAALFEVTRKHGKVKRGYLRELYPGTMGCLEESREIVKRALLGDDDAFKPTHFLSTKLNNEKTEIVSIRICPTDTLLEHLYSTLYANPIPKDTCIWLSPSVCLQRKGGDKNDSRANDIQTKIMFNGAVDELFTELPLSVESTAECSV